MTVLQWVVGDHTGVRSEVANRSTRRSDCARTPKSHPRQWADISGPAYSGSPRPSVIILFFLFLAFARKRIKTGDTPSRCCRLDLNHPLPWVGFRNFRTVSGAHGLWTQFPGHSLRRRVVYRTWSSSGPEGDKRHPTMLNT
jgi:hypothetical protein